MAGTTPPGFSDRRAGSAGGQRPSFTKRSHRLYTREQLEESRALWTAGEFSDEWREWRHLAAMEAGLIYPPEGTKWDSWGDDDPSERALLIRAIRETPDALRRILRTERVAAWSNVLALLIRDRDRDYADMDEEGRRERYRRQQVEPGPREASRVLADVLRVIADSSGVAPDLPALRRNEQS